MLFVDGLFRYFLIFGNALAIAVSFFYYQSIMLAIVHGLCGWLYIAYFVFMLQN
jgi:hypothetical protein